MEDTCGDCGCVKERCECKETEFLHWLTSQGVMFGTRPTAEKMLQSPDSLTCEQRAWLQSFVARRSRQPGRVRPGASAV